LPLPGSENQVKKILKKFIVKLFQPFINWFLWCSNKMRGNFFSATFELALVKKPEPRREKSYHRCGFMLLNLKCGSRTLLIMIFQEPRQFILKTKTGVKVFSYRK